MRGWRLERQHLLRPSTSLLEAVSDLCGVHAQLASAAELSLGLRVAGVGPEQIRGALWDERSLVKTWAMRGTLHLLPSSELPMWCAAASTRNRWIEANWLKGHGVSLADVEGVIALLRDTLDEQPRTREEIASAAPEHVREKLLSGWGTLLKPAAYLGHLCFGPNRGQQVTFVKPSRWLGSWRELDPADALSEVARRYLHIYGPSSHEDFAAWWGTQPAAGRRAFDGIASELVPLSVEGRSAWCLTTDIDALIHTKPTDRVHLLGHFDPYVIGSRPRNWLYDPSVRSRVSREAGWISPVILRGGWVVGVWEQRKRGKSVEVVVEPFEPIGDLGPQLEEEAAKLRAFLGAPVAIMAP